MNQNNQHISKQLSEQISKLSGCSSGSEILNYTAMVEGIDKEQQSNRKEDLQQFKMPANLVFAVKGPNSQRQQTSLLDDFSDRSCNYTPSYFRNDNLMFPPPFLGRQSSNREMNTKALQDNFLAVSKRSDSLLGKGRTDPRMDHLKLEKVQLGREIISSVVKSDHNMDQQSVQQGSQIIDRLQSTEKRTHFQIAKVEVGFGNMFEQFQQPSKEHNENRHEQFKILVTPESVKRPCYLNIEQDNASGPIFAGQSISKKSTNSDVIQERLKKSVEQVNLLSKSANASENEFLNPNVLKASKIKRSGHNMIQSKIITQGQINSPQKRSDNELRVIQKDSEMKKTIIQVAERMKSTVDLKPPSEYKVVPVATNLSEPDRHSINNAPQQNMKITDPLSPSEESPQKKESDNVLGTDIQGYLIAKIKNIEKLVDNLKQCSFCSASLAKCDEHAGVHRQQQKKLGKDKKRKSLHNLITDEFLNGLSSIDSDQKSNKKNKNLSKNQRNQQFNKKFEFLAERILKMEEMILKKSSKLCNCGISEQIIHSHNSRVTKINSPKNSSVKMMQLKRVKSQTKIYEQKYEEQFSLDQDFVRLQALIPKFDTKVQRNSSPEQLAELGIKILNYFKIKTQRGQSMDMTQHQNCVQFYYQANNVYIRLDFSGLFYIGEGESSQYSSQFNKSGEGIEILPNKYIYKGHFEKNKKDGEGMISYILGDKYKGQWSNDLYHGQGILYSKTSEYRGNFNEGKKHGFGKQKFKNGDVYQGQYYMNNYNGTGKYTWSNGTVYEGDFVNDQMSGKGTWISEYGDIYQGQYYKGKRHGYGRYTKRNGEVLEGEFSKGNLVKRTWKGILQADKELTFESIEEEGPRIVINDPYSKKLNAPKTTKVIIENQSPESSPKKSKKYSPRW